MSINLGNEGIAAARALAVSAEWVAIRRAFYEQMRKVFNIALESPPDLRADQVGYARAMRDMYMALESATTGDNQNHVEKPAPHAGKGRA